MESFTNFGIVVVQRGGASLLTSIRLSESAMIVNAF